MAIYKGYSGVNREVKKIYKGYGGINREIQQQYRGYGGTNRLVYQNKRPVTIKNCFLNGFDDQWKIYGVGNAYIDGWNPGGASSGIDNKMYTYWGYTPNGYGGHGGYTYYGETYALFNAWFSGIQARYSNGSFSGSPGTGADYDFSYPFRPNEKWYMSLMAYNNSGVNVLFTVGLSNNTGPETSNSTGNWEKKSFIGVTLEGIGYNPAFNTATLNNARPPQVNTFIMSTPMLINLSKAFGMGNEPSKEWCDVNIPYFLGTMIVEY